MTKPGEQCTAPRIRGKSRFESIGAQMLEQFGAQRPLRAGSLIVTVFGDIVAVRGGVVWMGSLIQLLKPFGLSERLVRTAVHRLVGEGWLESRRVGRRSYYRLSADGSARFDVAARKIYGPPQTRWDGRWSLIQILRSPAAGRERLKRELGWLGYTTIGPGLMASPGPDRDAISALRNGDNGARIIDWIATPGGPGTPEPLRRLLERGLALAEVGTRYAEFVDRFAAVDIASSRLRVLPSDAALLTRILLIHEYRRIVLRDPRLPLELWPTAWPAQQAFELCGRIYRRLCPASEAWLDRHLPIAPGHLPVADGGPAGRFAGAGQ